MTNRPHLLIIVIFSSHVQPTVIEISNSKLAFFHSQEEKRRKM